MKLGALILNAGFSARTGRLTPQPHLADQSSLEHCIRLFETAAVNTRVVVGCKPDGSCKKPGGKERYIPVFGSCFQRDLFSSIQAGAARLGACDGFFILPLAGPLLRPATIITLRNAFKGQKILFPTFAGERGCPPLIPAPLRRKILQADGQEQLQNILATKAHKEIAVWDAAVLRASSPPTGYTTTPHGQTARRDILTCKEAEIFARLHVPKKILPHGKKVAALALALARRIDSEKSLDEELIYGAALLHDIAKGEADHERKGAKILRGFGLDRMAAIVEAHKDLPPPPNGRLTEKELVYLADKLICGTQEVKIKEHFHQKLHRYKHNRNTCKAIRKRLRHAIAITGLWEKSSGESLESWLAQRR